MARISRTMRGRRGRFDCEERRPWLSFTTRGPRLVVEQAPEARFECGKRLRADEEEALDGARVALADDERRCALDARRLRERLVTADGRVELVAGQAGAQRLLVEAGLHADRHDAVGTTERSIAQEERASHLPELPLLAGAARRARGRGRARVEGQREIAAHVPELSGIDVIALDLLERAEVEGAAEGTLEVG